MTRATLPTVVDAADLERRVKDMYTRVAFDPQGNLSPDKAAVFQEAARLLRSGGVWRSPTSSQTRS